MSYSIGECIHDRERALAQAHAVLARFSDVQMQVLWKDGPRVFVSDSAKPTEVLVRLVTGLGGELEPRLFAYEEHAGAAVFSEHWHGALLWSVLDRLKKAKPEVYAAIVAMTEQEAR